MKFGGQFHLGKCISIRTRRSTARSPSPGPRPDRISPTFSSAFRATTSNRTADLPPPEQVRRACSCRTAGVHGSKLTFNYGVRWDIISRGTSKTTRSRQSFPASSRWCIRARRRARLPGRCRKSLEGCRRPAVATCHRASRRRRTHRDDKDSIRGELGLLLHSISRAVGGHHVRRAALRIQLPESCAAAVRQPFITAADGTDNGQRFPLRPPPLDASAANPYPSIDFVARSCR